VSTVTVTLNLDPGVAAGLMRFAEKASFEMASAVLRPSDIRNDQAHAILIGLAALERALADADVHTFPWIDTGKP
jgi:hypothetical protein